MGWEAKISKKNLYSWKVTGKVVQVMVTRVHDEDFRATDKTESKVPTSTWIPYIIKYSFRIQ